MRVLADKLKQRAETLGISNAEAARRVGMEERAYAHYVADRRDPSLTTLIKIAERLGSTPNALLGVEEEYLTNDTKNKLANRFVAAANLLTEEELEICVIQAEALAARHK